MVAAPTSPATSTAFAVDQTFTLPKGNAEVQVCLVFSIQRWCAHQALLGRITAAQLQPFHLNPVSPMRYAKH